MLSVDMLSAIMMGVAKPRLAMMSAVMLCVNMLSFDFTQSVIMLNVMKLILFPTTILKI
jgi:hypothetical protein